MSSADATQHSDRSRTAALPHRGGVVLSMTGPRRPAPDTCQCQYVAPYNDASENARTNRSAVLRRRGLR